MSDWPAADTIVSEIAAQQSEWLGHLQEFIQRPSEDPPGDTREVAAYLRSVLNEYGIEHETIAPREEMPNVVGSFDGGATDSPDGPHLVFNGHLDTYEVGELDRWDRDPFSGTIENGRIHGRGASDMHGGFVATLAAFCYLFENREKFDGTVSIVGVSDEESGGTWGTEYLVENHSEYTGDAVLNGEPSSGLIRFAERGPVWIEASVRGESAHSALPAGKSATEMLVRFLHELQTSSGLETLADVPPRIEETIRDGTERTDEIYGEGATEFSVTPSMNIGTIEGGGKVNLTAETARAEIDVRVPIGTDPDDAIEWMESIAERVPGDVLIEPFNVFPATYTDPEHLLLQSLQRNGARVKDGPEPPFSCGHGFSDLRYYRDKGVPAAYYGPTPYNMGSQNEYILVDEFVKSMQVHTLTAVDYLRNKT